MNEKLIEMRAALKYLIIKEKTDDEIVEELNIIYGPDSFTKHTVQKKRKRIQEGTFSIFDKP